MTGDKKYPHKGYRGDYYNRRDVIKRMLALGGIGAAGAYLAFAPEDFPGSLRDHSGLRSMPVELPFQLPDFRVEPANPSIQVGVGRGGDEDQGGQDQRRQPAGGDARAGRARSGVAGGAPGADDVDQRRDRARQRPYDPGIRIRPRRRRGRSGSLRGFANPGGKHPYTFASASEAVVPEIRLSPVASLNRRGCQQSSSEAMQLPPRSPRSRNGTKCLPASAFPARRAPRNSRSLM